MTDLDPALRARVQELAADIQSCQYSRENQDGFVLGDPVEIQTLLGEAGVPDHD